MQHEPEIAPPRPGAHQCEHHPERHRRRRTHRGAGSAETMDQESVERHVEQRAGAEHRRDALETVVIDGVTVVGHQQPVARQRQHIERKQPRGRPERLAV